MINLDTFKEYLYRWYLIPDGKPFDTPNTNSSLLPVIYQGIPAILKIARAPEEHMSGLLMTWWNGKGTAKVFAHDQNAIVMERALDKPSLVDMVKKGVDMVKKGNDDEASRIICQVAAKIHDKKQAFLPTGLPYLETWFKELDPIAKEYGGTLKKASIIARELLNHPDKIVVLHGDLHHENVLYFPQHGWLAIDPKGLIGDRYFDYANIVRNPEFDIVIATAPGRFSRQISIISEAANLDRHRLLQWIVAFTGLSAAWFLEDGVKSELDFAIAKLALDELGDI